MSHCHSIWGIIKDCEVFFLVMRPYHEYCGIINDFEACLLDIIQYQGCEVFSRFEKHIYQLWGIITYCGVSSLALRNHYWILNILTDWQKTALVRHYLNLWHFHRLWGILIFSEVFSLPSRNICWSWGTIMVWRLWGIHTRCRGFLLDMRRCHWLWGFFTVFEAFSMAVRRSH